MTEKEQLCYAYVQLPGTFEWVPCGVLTVSEIANLKESSNL